MRRRNTEAISLKKKNGESYCFRGDEIPLSIRNDSSLSSLYNNGDLEAKSKLPENVRNKIPLMVIFLKRKHFNLTLMV